MEFSSKNIKLLVVMLLMMATAIVAAYFIGKEDSQSKGLSKESRLVRWFIFV